MKYPDAGLTKGFVYVATGQKFIAEALISCNSLKRVMPESHVTLFTDIEYVNHNNCFDSVIHLDDAKNDFFDKIAAFTNAPYDINVFLDTDTFLCEDVSELFDIMSRFDIAAVRDHWAVGSEGEISCFDDFNTGVVVYKRNAKTTKAFIKWKEIYTNQINYNNFIQHDQPSFREALYTSKNLSIYVLPKNYNLRLTSPIMLGIGYRPKILHGRVDDFDRIVSVMNITDDFRFLIPNGSFVNRTYMAVIDTKSGYIFNSLIYVSKVLTSWTRKIVKSARVIRS